jgi:hypothetical protein
MSAPLSTPRWTVLITVALSMMALAVAGVLYTGYVDGQREVAERESDRRWCALLNTLDQAYSAVPPSTELGRRVAEEIRKLRADLDC